MGWKWRLLITELKPAGQCLAANTSLEYSSSGTVLITSCRILFWCCLRECSGNSWKTMCNPSHSVVWEKSLEMGNSRMRHRQPLQGVMTTDVICINVLVASTRMMDHDWDHRQSQQSPFWRARLTSYSNRVVWHKPGTPVFMIYFNQISYLWKEAIASLHHRYKYYANVHFMSRSSPAPLVHFRLGRMTTAIIKWVEGNTERQFLIFLLKRWWRKSVCHTRGQWERGCLWVSFEDRITHVLVQSRLKN